MGLKRGDKGRAEVDLGDPRAERMDNMPNSVPHPAIVDAYRSAIGRPRKALETPALILDLDVAKENIRSMAQKMSNTHARLRPHIKGQKSPELARLQVDAGAIGVCTATVWEAIVMSRAGIPDVLIANQVVGPDKIAALAQAAKHGHITVAVDDARNVRDLSSAMVSVGGSLDLLIEVDVGMERGGVRSPEEAVALAQRIRDLPGVRLRGVQGYEGHCMTETDRAVRVEGLPRRWTISAAWYSASPRRDFPVRSCRRGEPARMISRACIPE